MPPTPQPRPSGREPGALAAPVSSDSVHSLLRRSDVREQIQLALPRHMTPDRLLRIALTEIRRQPKLAECSSSSLLAAIFSCAQLGLEPGGALGHAYLVPYGREVQFVMGYRGMIDIARRSGLMKSISAHAVYEGDQFDCALGLTTTLKHQPDWENPNRADPSKLKFVYAVAHLADGGTQFEVMSRAEIDLIRKRSKSGSSGPWASDYAAMAQKTVVRRLFKWLPVSIELARAVGLDEAAELGQRQESELDVVLTPEPIVSTVRIVDEPEASPASTTTRGSLTTEQVETVSRAMSLRLEESGRVALLRRLGVEHVEQIPAEQFDEVIRLLTDSPTVRTLNSATDDEGVAAA